uniref:Uncharacterized protein n=1 Tax=Gallus gallus TaxID=9031 RepID=A0A8V0X7N3_CHICK
MGQCVGHNEVIGLCRVGGGSIYGSLWVPLWVPLWVNVWVNVWVDLWVTLWGAMGHSMGLSIGHNEVIGLCRVGGDAAGPGREHWAEMLANPRTPIEQWHPLVEEKALALPKAPAREKASGEKTTEPYWEHWFVLGALGGGTGMDWE